MLTFAIHQYSDFVTDLLFIPWSQASVKFNALSCGRHANKIDITTLNYFLGVVTIIKTSIFVAVMSKEPR